MCLVYSHGADADHIAAIDNTTRKLMQEDKRPLTVGTWFSLGHSTVVIILVVGLVFATSTVTKSIPSLQNVGDFAGTLVSGIFLFLIAIINVIIVREIYRIFVGLKEGKIDHSQLEDQLNNKGFINTHFGKLFKLVEKPYQMYVVGFLFGLGFDTATEVLLIGLSVGIGVTGSVPLWAVMVLPLMFTVGMVTTDTSDGISMRLAYGWAFQHPIRKVYYNLTISIMSIMVAFGIGGIELLQVIAMEFGWNSGFWGWLQNLDFETLGFAIIAIFATTWLVSIWYYRRKGYEEKFDREKFQGTVGPPSNGG